MKTYSDNKMVFHTVNYFSRKQIPVVITFIIIATWSIYITIFKSRDADPLIIKIISIVLMGVFIYKILIDTAISWYKNIYYLEIDGDVIRGFNMFNKQRKLNFYDIRCIRKVLGDDSLVIVDNMGEKFDIEPDIDFYGFIYDYLLQKLPETTEVDMKAVNKFRSRPNYWSYTKRYPFKTEYPPGYLEWFLPILEKQKAEMIATGVLKAGVLYGQDEKHVW